MRKRFYLLPVYLGLFSLVLTIPLVVMKITTKQPVTTFQSQATQTYTTVSLFPQKATYKMTAEIPVGIIFESNDKLIKNADVVVIYDPKMVSVTSVARGIVMDNYQTVRFDNKLGQVTIFSSNNAEKAINGILASLKFKPLKAGVVTFEFANGTTAEKTYGAEFVITK